MYMNIDPSMFKWLNKNHVTLSFHILNKNPQVGLELLFFLFVDVKNCLQCEMPVSITVIL